MPRYILVHDTASTNSYLARIASLLPSGTVIYTPCQSAGRGQRGNSWESEPGKNITFSLLIKNIPIPPASQFYISEAVSIAIVEVLSSYSPGFSVKWPNDIYFHDKKVCGILIEHSLVGSAIAHSIIGVGININQTVFTSDAPNPTSLKLITGVSDDYTLDDILHRVCDAIYRLASLPDTSPSYLADMHRLYLSRLYRFDGDSHKFATPDGSIFDAKIDTVLPDGTFCLKLADGNVKHYLFKEVSFII